MKTINVQQAKTHLSRLLEEVALGQEIVLAKAGKPVARLIPYRAKVANRVGGQFAGQISESDDCWTSPEDPLGDSVDGPLYQRDKEGTQPAHESSRVAEPRPDYL